MAFIKDMYRDEIRDGWLVKAGIKKSWNRMLEIWQEVDRICRKYKIKYWAAFGTLLGAVRHGGFIPWDTDMDLCMMRPEYNIFCDAVERELAKKDSPFEIARVDYNNFRIALSTTVMLGKEDLHEREPDRTYGMMIEVFPLDITEDGTPTGNISTWKLWRVLRSSDDETYSQLKDITDSSNFMFDDLQVLENFRALSEKEKQNFYRKYAELLFNKSNELVWIDHVVRGQPEQHYPKDVFRETIYLPFETVQMPVPVDYDKILTAYYGDWHKFVYDRIFHIGKIHSPDIPYKEFLERVDFDFMFPQENNAST
ncbi:MAG: LicD family protein [Quinella sp. 3Q1]|nr:LicD family protein [Quinella sp. 3Q1]MBR6888295.1 LicD family protein [Selenomonadaceae bacterium]